MIRFVKPPQEIIKVGDKPFLNFPVNIVRVEYLMKSALHADYNPTSSFILPTIEFGGISCKWYFKSEQERDEEFDSILKRFSL